MSTKSLLVHGVTLSEMRDFTFELLVIPAFLFLQPVKVSSSSASSVKTGPHNSMSSAIQLVSYLLYCQFIQSGFFQFDFKNTVWDYGWDEGDQLANDLHVFLLALNEDECGVCFFQSLGMLSISMTSLWCHPAPLALLIASHLVPKICAHTIFSGVL